MLFCPFDPFFFDLWAKEKGERKKRRKKRFVLDVTSSQMGLLKSELCSAEKQNEQQQQCPYWHVPCSWEGPKGAAPLPKNYALRKAPTLVLAI